jgi:hypothetical protein
MEKFKFKVILKYLFWGYLPIALLSIVLNLFNIMPVEINGKDTYGLLSAFILLLTVPIVVLFGAIHIWLLLNLGFVIHKNLFKTAD